MLVDGNPDPAAVLPDDFNLGQAAMRAYGKTPLLL